MNPTVDPERDLTLTRVIRAPRNAVWTAWTTPSSFEKWWVPAPARCRVEEMELRAGGSFVTSISDGGAEFAPHTAGCFLAIDQGERIVFTDALLGGFRPAEQPFITAIITLADHPDGTEYSAHVMHRTSADREMHRELGFYDGWGTVAAQLARLVER